MIEQGLMTEQGQAMIDLAKATGTWQVAADDELPDDLPMLLDGNDAAPSQLRGASRRRRSG